MRKKEIWTQVNDIYLESKNIEDIIIDINENKTKLRLSFCKNDKIFKECRINILPDSCEDITVI